MISTVGSTSGGSYSRVPVMPVCQLGPPFRRGCGFHERVIPQGGYHARNHPGPLTPQKFLMGAGIEGLLTSAAFTNADGLVHFVMDKRPIMDAALMQA